MEVAAEALLSSVFDFLLGQLASSDLMQYAREARVHTELNKWKTELVSIRMRLSDAEDKQITDDHVKSWLNQLRALVYDMEDVLDEFSYEVTRRKLMAAQAQEPGTSNRRLSKFIPTCCANFNPAPTVRLLNMGAKIREISGKLRDLSDTKGVLKEAIGAAKPAGRRSNPPTPTSNEQVYGRDEDKRMILDLLAKVETNHKTLDVICIVGLGGMGKTTLARLVYNDDEVAKTFDLKGWACVYDVFHLENTMKSILSSLEPHQTSSSLDFERELQNALTNKKFLLILDDVWTENFSDWDRLRAPLSVGAKGSKVIVTTRNTNVALMMGRASNCHELTPLPEDACRSVFFDSAFELRDVDNHPELELIGMEIVAKCRGSPLAAKALGGLLRNKKTEKEWEGVLKSKIWELPNTKCDIFPVLFLSYLHLPSYLKRCFAYCAIFPQDYKFDQRTLVLLWMAEGLIDQPNSNNQTIEDLGDECFQELLSRSFFVPLGDHKSYFVMHDLIHDLAKAVSAGIFLCLGDNSESHQQSQIHKVFQIPRQTCHLSFTLENFHLFKKLEDFQVLRHLRTFMALPVAHELPRYTKNLVYHDLMLKFQQLRVLSLSGYMVSILSDSIGALKHLRYLNLSSTRIESLPHSVTNLCNLQTLILSYCSRLTRLPNDIGNIISPRHLDVVGCPLLENMPQQIGKIKELQKLSHFITGKEGFLGIKELKDLSNLKGEIQISKLENVLEVQDARDANLKGKPKIEKLSLIWCEKAGGSNDEGVLFSLQPHNSLKDLRIKGYGGGKFSTWISNPSYSKLVTLSLIGCVQCKSVPPVGQLPSLKEVYIRGMDGVESMGLEFEGQVSALTKPFQCLESLSFQDMKEWTEWRWSSESFSNLLRLEVWNCPKLVGKLPVHLTSLVELRIETCPAMVVPIPTEIRSLQKFKYYRYSSRFDFRQEMKGSSLCGSKAISHFDVGGISAGLYHELKQSLSSAVELMDIDNTGGLGCEWVDGLGVGNVQRLRISGYKQLESLGEEKEDHGLLPRLRSLHIDGCGNLRSLPGWILKTNNNNCPLEELTIAECPSFICFPRGPLIPTLKILRIQDCENIVSLPEDMGGLEELCIRKCPSLVDFPKGPLSPALKQLAIEDCENLKSLPERMNRCAALEDVWMRGCPSVVDFPQGGLPPSLKKLVIYVCEKMGCLPEGIMQMPHDPNTAPSDHTPSTHSSSALQVLEIHECPSLASFPCGKFPSTLVSLRIGCCVELPSISNEMFDACADSLESLSLTNYPHLKTIPDFLHNLTSLWIKECENVELQPRVFRNLTSLASLTIFACKNVKMPLSEWGLAGLTSLTSLYIRRISLQATTFFSNNYNHLPLLPTTLHELTISGFQNLESLASLSLQTLTCLRTLSISECPKLHSFIPKEGLPDMLSRLYIRDCPLLIQRCSEKTGEDWPKIAHIPRLWIS